jgi:gliding motility-associated-like protein
LKVGSTTGCADSVTKSVTISVLPTADFVLLTTTPKTYEPVEFADQSIDASLWRWTFGTDDTLFLQDPVYTYKVAGTFNIQLYIESLAGCKDSTSLITSVIGEEVLPPKVPTAFTPNDDGTNDVYYVRGGPFTEIDFRIYNQWGEVVFETQNPDEGWDGTYKGQKQPLGVYLFTIKAVTVDGKEYQKSGEVNLIE